MNDTKQRNELTPEMKREAFFAVIRRITQLQADRDDLLPKVSLSDAELTEAEEIYRLAKENNERLRFSLSNIEIEIGTLTELHFKTPEDQWQPATDVRPARRAKDDTSRGTRSDMERESGEMTVERLIAGVMRLHPDQSYNIDELHDYVMRQGRGTTWGTTKARLTDLKTKGKVIYHNNAKTWQWRAEETKRKGGRPRSENSVRALIETYDKVPFEMKELVSWIKVRKPDATRHNIQKQVQEAIKNGTIKKVGDLYWRV